eukprot:TRINITY_DN193_c0_g1_i8.p1 TRINITY_DN193_c0_g1~~TRINITY_DN193_c0_g1_i8.p1  ORF type:complete len:1885 (+),score=593.69 TRINITY_DN193_c0_g1_i8:92-5746(+)
MSATKKELKLIVKRFKKLPKDFDGWRTLFNDFLCMIPPLDDNRSRSQFDITDKKVLDQLFAICNSVSPDSIEEVRLILSVAWRLFGNAPLFKQIAKCDISGFMKLFVEYFNVIGNDNSTMGLECIYSMISRQFDDADNKYMKYEAANRAQFFQCDGLKVLEEHLCHSVTLKIIFSLLVSSQPSTAFESNQSLVEMLIKKMSSINRIICDSTLGEARRLALMILQGLLLEMNEEQYREIQTTSLSHGILLTMLCDAVSMKVPLELRDEARGVVELMCTGHQNALKAIRNVFCNSFMDSVIAPSMVVSRFSDEHISSKPVGKQQRLIDAQKVKNTIFKTGESTSENWKELWIKLDSDYRSLYVIWNQEARLCLHRTLTAELEDFRISSLGESGSVWDWQRFNVFPMKCFINDLNVNGVYVDVLSEGLEAGKETTLSNVPELMEALLHRVLIEDNNDWKLKCLKTYRLLGTLPPNVAKIRPGLSSIMWLLKHCTLGDNERISGAIGDKNLFLMIRDECLKILQFALSDIGNIMTLIKLPGAISTLTELVAGEMPLPNVGSDETAVENEADEEALAEKSSNKSITCMTSEQAKQVILTVLRSACKYTARMKLSLAVSPHLECICSALLHSEDKTQSLDIISALLDRCATIIPYEDVLQLVLYDALQSNMMTAQHALILKKYHKGGRSTRKTLTTVITSHYPVHFKHDASEGLTSVNGSLLLPFLPPQMIRCLMEKSPSDFSALFMSESVDSCDLLWNGQMRTHLSGNLKSALYHTIKEPVSFPCPEPVVIEFTALKDNLSVAGVFIEPFTEESVCVISPNSIGPAFMKSLESQIIEDFKSVVDNTPWILETQQSEIIASTENVSENKDSQKSNEEESEEQQEEGEEDVVVEETIEETEEVENPYTLSAETMITLKRLTSLTGALNVTVKKHKYQPSIDKAVIHASFVSGALSRLTVNSEEYALMLDLLDHVIGLIRILLSESTSSKSIINQTAGSCLRGRALACIASVLDTIGVKRAGEAGTELGISEQSLAESVLIILRNVFETNSFQMQSSHLPHLNLSALVSLLVALCSPDTMQRLPNIGENALCCVMALAACDNSCRLALVSAGGLPLLLLTAASTSHHELKKDDVDNNEKINDENETNVLPLVVENAGSCLLNLVTHSGAINITNTDTAEGATKHVLTLMRQWATPGLTKMLLRGNSNGFLNTLRLVDGNDRDTAEVIWNQSMRDHLVIELTQVIEKYGFTNWDISSVCYENSYLDMYPSLQTETIVSDIYLRPLVAGGEFASYSIDYPNAGVFLTQTLESIHKLTDIPIQNNEAKEEEEEKDIVKEDESTSDDETSVKDETNDDDDVVVDATVEKEEQQQEENVKQTVEEKNLMLFIEGRKRNDFLLLNAALKIVMTCKEAEQDIGKNSIRIAELLIEFTKLHDEEVKLAVLNVLPLLCITQLLSESLRSSVNVLLGGLVTAKTSELRAAYVNLFVIMMTVNPTFIMLFLTRGVTLTVLDLLMNNSETMEVRLNSGKFISLSCANTKATTDYLKMLFFPLFSSTIRHEPVLMGGSVNSPEVMVEIVDKDVCDPLLLWNEPMRKDLKIFINNDMNRLREKFPSNEDKTFFNVIQFGDYPYQQISLKERLHKPTLDDELLVYDVFVKVFNNKPHSKQLDVVGFLVALLNDCKDWLSMMKESQGNADKRLIRDQNLMWEAIHNILENNPDLHTSGDVVDAMPLCFRQFDDNITLDVQDKCMDVLLVLLKVPACVQRLENDEDRNGITDMATAVLRMLTVAHKVTNDDEKYVKVFDILTDLVRRSSVALPLMTKSGVILQAMSALLSTDSKRNTKEAAASLLIAMEQDNDQLHGHDIFEAMLSPNFAEIFEFCSEEMKVMQEKNDV